MSEKDSTGAQNILGPLLTRVRVEAGLTPLQVSNRFTEYGCKCTPEHIVEMEEQRVPIRDFELVIIEKVFPGHGSEIMNLIAQHANAEEEHSR